MHLNRLEPCGFGEGFSLIERESLSHAGDGISAHCGWGTQGRQSGAELADPFAKEIVPDDQSLRDLSHSAERSDNIGVRQVVKYERGVSDIAFRTFHEKCCISNVASAIVRRDITIQALALGEALRDLVNARDLEAPTSAFREISRRSTDCSIPAAPIDQSQGVPASRCDPSLNGLTERLSTCSPSIEPPKHAQFCQDGGGIRLELVHLLAERRSKCLGVTCHEKLCEVQTRPMKLSTSSFVCLASVILCVSVACTNRNYNDLMRVTQETNGSIASLEETYNGNGSVSQRMEARDRIITLRKKQMIMAQRINVATMPEVKDKSITTEQGQAKKAELVEAATKRYEQAKALPVPGK